MTAAAKILLSGNLGFLPKLEGEHLSQAEFEFAELMLEYESGVEKHAKEGGDFAPTGAIRRKLLEAFRWSYRREQRFVLDTCDMGHDYAKLRGVDGQRCPFCLAIGLANARAERDELRAITVTSLSLRPQADGSAKGATA